MTSEVYWVMVNRNWDGRIAVRHSKRVVSGSLEVAQTIPKVKGRGVEEVKFVFFKPEHLLLLPEDLEKERRKRKLRQDIIAQIQANKTYPDFARDNPNGDCWQDEQGLWHSIYFHRHDTDDLDCLNIYNSVEWNHKTWFGGTRI